MIALGSSCYFVYSFLYILFEIVGSGLYLRPTFVQIQFNIDIY
ncbi:uncharacterized protein M6B38_398080 [Iris pallida]|uniref:Uncharacterized protein n=1 Tax=Iris pallida TaxID=29817 RepID=A0AAX6FVK2_IRIPA|nr:uncharacterized protein M6B38_160925 [Iris pallida]KAJ6820223.1 uncharacterized protein M6B38_398080 [Iris pallida]